MTSANVRAGLCLAVMILVGSCYNPVIGEGDFLCGPGDSCPVGWRCDQADKRCRRALTTDAAATADRPPVSQPDTAPMMCMRGLTCSAGATAGAVCDPVCQSGCSCDKKCSFTGAQVACVTTPPGAKQAYEECNPGNDNCAPGLLCTAENETACGAHCYRACRVDADCGPNARCTDALGDATGTRVLSKICSPRIENCNPVGLQAACMNAGPGNRPLPTFGCYMLDHTVDEATVCRCAGTLDAGVACSARGSCKPGLECLAGFGADAATRCRRLCSLTGVGVACQLGNTCRPIGPSTRVGACL
ncbi:MAG TPA: hypothetical protein VGG33_29700 [Polyangia bacterium]